VPIDYDSRTCPRKSTSFVVQYAGPHGPSGKQISKLPDEQTPGCRKSHVEDEANAGLLLRRAPTIPNPMRMPVRNFILYLQKLRIVIRAAVRRLTMAHVPHGATL
jgi:hypothetical protein